MPSKSTENGNSFSTIYKSRGDREAQASKSYRRRSVRNERKLRKDERMDQRRGLLEMSALSESDSTDLDQESDYNVQEDVIEHDSIETRKSAKSKTKAESRADSRALSLKERLVKWREEKKKQMEQNKKQLPAFVVKNVEYKSDSNLYGKAPKNAKKLSKPELNFNFAENAREKGLQHNQKTVKSLSKQSNNPAPTRNQPLKKSKETEIKQTVPLRTQATRVTRQAAKTESSKGKSEAKKLLTREVKSMKDLHSTVQESKSKPRPVKGDLHLRLTAAAAAKKQENSEKPKEFLRAKPHQFAGGRTTRSQTKQSKSEDETSTGKYHPSAVSKKLPGRKQISTNMSDNNVEVPKSTALQESRPKSNQQADVKGLIKDGQFEKSIGNENTTNESDDQSGKEEPRSARNPRRSIRFAKKQANVDEHLENMEENPASENKGNVELERKSDMEQCNVGQSDICVDFEHPNIVRKSTPGRKSRQYIPPIELNAKSPHNETPHRMSRSSMVAKHVSGLEEQTGSNEAEPINLMIQMSFSSIAKDSTASSSEEEHFFTKMKTTTTPGRKSRRSKIDSSLNVRTPRRSVGKAGFQLKEESTNVWDVGSLGDDKQKSAYETEKSSSEDEKWEDEIKATPGKRARKSTQNTAVIEGDQFKPNENIFSPKRAKLAVNTTEASPVDKEITNLAVVFTPGKSPRRSVFKLVPGDNTDLTTGVHVGIAIEKNTPKAKLSSSTEVDSAEDPGSKIDRRKSNRSISVSARTEKRNSIAKTKRTPRRKSEHVTSGYAGSNESQTSSESDMSGNRGEIVATPVRKARRSVITPTATNTLDLQNVNSNSSAKTVHVKATSDKDNQVEGCLGDVAEQSLTDPGIADTQMSPEVNYPTDVPRQYNKKGSYSSKVPSSSSSRIANKGNKRRSGKKTPKSARRPSCSRTRNSATPSSFSPLSRRCKSTSTVVSVSEEGTSSLKGKVVVEQAVTPNSSFAENKLPVSDLGRRKSARRSEARGLLREKEMSENSVYRLAKPSILEAESGPLQEITVEKVEGETSYIEIPLDESETSFKTTSSASTPTLFSKESSTNNEMATDEPMVLGNSSTETEAFTPRKSCNVTKSSQDSMPSIEATPDLPPRVAVREFKTPFQAPRSAHRAKGSSTRPRRKTVHSTPTRSPEEMIKILERSPMIEMTRRRSRHVSSPASVLPLDLNLSVEPSSPVSSSSPNSGVLAKGPQIVPSGPDSEENVATNADLETSEPKEGELTSETNRHPEPHVTERVLHFRNIVVSETKRLNELCKTWEEIAAYTFGISEEILGQIRTTVGKAQLLIDQRFKQFSGLVDNCEFNLGEQKTRPEDLQGFWEMIYFQVEDVNGLFDQLKVLQDNNWEKQKSPPKILKKKQGVAKASKPKGVSNFKAFRREMLLRKAQKAAATVPQDSAPIIDSPVATVTGEKTEAVQQQNLEFDGIFFKVTSPARTAKGKRTTLGSHTNSPGAETPGLDAKPTEVTGDNSTQSPKPDPTSIPVAANKENDVNQQEKMTPIFYGVKRLSYVPVIPSPLLKDTTGITTPKKK